MKALQLDSIEKPQKIAMAVMMALLLGFGVMAYQIFVSSQAVLSTKSEMADKQRTLEVVEREYEAEVQRKEALGLNVRLIQNSLAVYDELRGNSMRPLPLVNKVSQSLGRTLKLDAFKMIENVQRVRPNFNSSPEEEATTYDAFLQLSFDPKVEPEIAVGEVDKLRLRLQNLFPENEVEITKQAFNAEVSTTFMGETDRVPAQTAEESDLTAELAIRGVKQ